MESPAHYDRMDEDESNFAPLAGTDTVKELLEVEQSSHAASAQLYPHKSTPYGHDAGYLLVTDPNPLSYSPTEAELQSTARDAAQSLLNYLLTMCPVSAAGSTGSVTMTLPTPTTLLPREKPIPVPKPPTKWEQFAARKGINPKGGRKDGENRAGKLVYDVAKGQWLSKWGYKGKNREEDWLVEVDEKERKAGAAEADVRGMKRAERKEKARRNERAQRANERRERSGRGRT